MINEMGQEYGVYLVQVGQWEKAIQERVKRLFEGKRGSKPVLDHQKPERLYSEIGKLKMILLKLKTRGMNVPELATSNDTLDFRLFSCL